MLCQRPEEASMDTDEKSPINKAHNSLNEEITSLERRLQDQFHLRGTLEKALGFRSSSFSDNHGSPIPKEAMEVIKEIAVLEVEVLHLERHLLSLYRSAFDHSSNNFFSPDLQQDSSLPLTSQSRISHQNGNIVKKQERVKSRSSLVSESQDSHSINNYHDLESPKKSDSMQKNKISFPRSISCSYKWNSSPTCLDGCHFGSGTLIKDMRNSSSRPSSLADHLGASIADHLPETPNKISEDILRCMAAIYCKLAGHSLPQSLVFSPTSSLSSASTFSPQDNVDTWSPRCNIEGISNRCKPGGCKENHGPYSGMLEVSSIRVDGDRLNYAAQILQNFRSLVQRLEKVDPRKMKHEEKLAFWINIHNALVMHAYLAYGIPPSNLKRESLISKAAYNVGGQSINACLIESSILGCQPQRSTLFPYGFTEDEGFVPSLSSLAHPGIYASHDRILVGVLAHLWYMNPGEIQKPNPCFLEEAKPLPPLCYGIQWLRTLLSPGARNKGSNDKHAYAIEHPEPLLHFALCMGGYSDPAVRVYSRKRIFKELEIAKEEYIQASIKLKDTRIILPKTLDHYARDASLSLSGLLDVIQGSVTQEQQKPMQKCVDGRPPKNIVQFSPYNSAFRYIIHRDIAKYNTNFDKIVPE